MKFLHISDIHLGCTRYHLPESPRDFFDAWVDVLKKYAIAEKVDFVIMGGDFFHKKSVPPETMNYAVAGLSLLKEAGIPIVGIEGNHDQKSSDSEFSWLRSLADWDLLILLEPDNVDGELVYRKWDKEKKRGGYIDLGRARIYGSNWYGAASNYAIPMLTSSIENSLREKAFNILILHTDVEEHQTHPIPALSMANLKTLKAVTNYVALGHTHKCYSIDNWCFNPGSLEITSVDEYQEKRGAWLVTVDKKNKLKAEHVRNYVQRPFQRIAFDVTECKEPKEVTEGVLKIVNSTKLEPPFGAPMPVIEITLKGCLGFSNSLLELNKIRDETKDITYALHVMLKNKTVPEKYGKDVNPEDVTREQIERKVVEGLVGRDSRYKSRTAGVSDAVIGAKKMALLDESPDKIVDFIAEMIGEQKK